MCKLSDRRSSLFVSHSLSDCLSLCVHSFLVIAGHVLSVFIAQCDYMYSILPEYSNTTVSPGLARAAPAEPRASRLVGVAIAPRSSQ